MVLLGVQSWVADGLKYMHKVASGALQDESLQEFPPRPVGAHKAARLPPYIHRFLSRVRY